jgi:hypothetical protein
MPFRKVSKEGWLNTSMAVLNFVVAGAESL